jgi:sugar phosphate isomerase/epimerase
MSKFILSAFADEAAEDLKTQMDIMELNGIGFIEMRNVNGKSIVRYTLDEVEEIKKELDKRGFRISAVGSPIGKIKITDDFGPHLELFRHTLKIAQILETKYIRMFSFFIPKGESAETYRQEVMKRWSDFLAEVEGTGLVLLHENEKDIYGDTPERCLDLINTMNSSGMKAVFDPANFVQCDVETYPKAYKMLEEHIEYMHIKDALYKDHSVVPAGLGDGKLKEILTALHKRGFEGFLSIEPHLGSFAGFAELELNPIMKDLPEGGPQKFVIAADALKKLIKEVTQE